MVKATTDCPEGQSGKSGFRQLDEREQAFAELMEGTTHQYVLKYRFKTSNILISLKIRFTLPLLNSCPGMLIGGNASSLLVRTLRLLKALAAAVVPLLFA